MKQKCSRCGEKKSVSSFHRDRYKSSGRRSECKACSVAKKQRRCTRCKATKPFSDFDRYGHTTRLLPWCKACASAKPISVKKPETKQCKRCGAVKALTKDFGRHSKTHDGFQTICRTCWSAIGTRAAHKTKNNAPQKTKQCTKCGETKELNLFSHNINHFDGRQYWCKTCCANYSKTRQNTGKKCGKCGSYKNIDNFHRQASSKDGAQCWCKDCIKQYRIAKIRADVLAHEQNNKRKAQQANVSQSQIAPSTQRMSVLPDNVIAQTVSKFVEQYVSDKLDSLIATIVKIGKAIIEEGKLVQLSAKTRS